MIDLKKVVREALQKHSPKTFNVTEHYQAIARAVHRATLEAVHEELGATCDCARHINDRFEALDREGGSPTESLPDKIDRLQSELTDARARLAREGGDE